MLALLLIIPVLCFVRPETWEQLVVGSEWILNNFLKNLEGRVDPRMVVLSIVLCVVGGLFCVCLSELSGFWIISCFRDRDATLVDEYPDYKTKKES